MSKQWYFQVMGAEVGPLSPGELADKVKRGQIQADTLVRKGEDGKWMPADRIKGLLSPPPDAVSTDVAEMLAAPSEQKKSTGAAPKTVDPLTQEGESTYHLDGDKAAALPIEQQQTEFDFFQFVGFRQAITTPLHEALEAHARQHHLTFTQITRRALAQFLGRPELGEDKPADAPAETLLAEPQPAAAVTASPDK